MYHLIDRTVLNSLQYMLTMISECTLSHLIDRAILYSLYVDYDIIVCLSHLIDRTVLYSLDVDYDIIVCLVSPDRQDCPQQSVC